MTQSHKISATGFIVWGICALFFTYEFLLRTVLGTFEHPLITDLNLNLVTFALLSSTAYQVVYGSMQIPVGILLAKFGLKKSLFMASLLCALSVFGFGATHAFDSAFLFRVVMGLGSSFGFIGLLVAVYDWMPRQKIGLFIGLSQLIGTLGPMVAAGPLNDIANDSSIDWRFIFFGLGVLGVIISLLILALVKNNKDYTGTFQILKRPKPLLTTLAQLLSQTQVWFIALYSAAIYFTIEYLSENSGKAFLMLNGYTMKSASYMITVAWVGYAIGCPLLGYISDLTGKRKNVLSLSALISLIAAIIIIYYPAHSYMLTSAFIALGAGAGGQSVGFAIMAEQCNEQSIAIGLGFNNALIGFLGAINAPLIGWLLNKYSQGQPPTIINFQDAFWVIIGFMVFALFLSTFLIKETFCKSTKETTKLYL
jgi:MFS family permease